MGKLKKVLDEFCDDIEATGGVTPNPDDDGTHVLVADEEWVDLAETYLTACEALGRKPKIKRGR